MVSAHLVDIAQELKKQLLARRNRISNVVSGPGTENLLDIQSRCKAEHF